MSGNDVEDFIAKHGVKKLPPGNAVGAADLSIWAKRRATGKSGVPEKKIKRRRKRLKK